MTMTTRAFVTGGAEFLGRTLVTTLRDVGATYRRWRARWRRGRSTLRAPSRRPTRAITDVAGTEGT